MNNTIQITDIGLIKYIFKDFINSSLWQEVHVNKYRSYYYLTICGEFNGKYLTELQKYFNILSLKSNEERTITMKLRKID